ncbi:hypothetical protein [Nocardioides pantholopis]|uniref:hypothetical protein n=1 Tax=Nocardioides pantholopis TaxID=2483798 RepID=UPI000FDB2C41|nr:hypothetical protein [Nocardioides pantholopis]
MTADPTIRPQLDPREAAAEARSILACPASVTLMVPGRSGVGAEDGLGLQDAQGTPTFLCVPGSGLAAAVGREAVVTVRSGLGPSASKERAAVVTITGRLEVTGNDTCECCAEPRLFVSVVPRTVALCSGPDAAERTHVPLAEYAAAGHALNRGFLQRSSEHANDCHQDQLRRSVSAATGTPVGEVLGVAVSDLRPGRVTLSWVDPQGAHRSVLTFPRTARTPAELGDLLRRELGTGC